MTRKRASANCGTSGRDFVMRALPGQKWPGTADSGAIEGAAILVFAVAVSIIAVPAWPLRKLRT